jgi:DNA-directed RNA polymerase subunit RPC12/RpoP
MNCPYCGSDDLYFDPIMRNYICEECDKIIEPEELEDD